MGMESERRYFARGEVVILDTSVAYPYVVYGTNMQADDMTYGMVRYLDANMNDVILLGTVRDELYGKLGGREGVAKYPRHGRLLKQARVVKGYSKHLSSVKNIQMKAVYGRKTGEVPAWLDAKWRAIKNRRYRRIEDVPEYMYETFLTKLYKDAGRDRDILAQALSLTSKSPVLVLSRDGDMLAFDDAMPVISGNIMRILHPDCFGPEPAKS